MGKKEKKVKIIDSNVKVSTDSVAAHIVKQKDKLEKKRLKKLRQKLKKANALKIIKDAVDSGNPTIKQEIKTEDIAKENQSNISNTNVDNNKATSFKRSARIIVRNMSFKATDDSLKEHFAQFGEVLEVKILRKSGGKLVGCAFIQYKNVPMAKKAILETNMKPFLGRPISVDWAIPKDKYMKHIIEESINSESLDRIKKEIKSDNGDNENGLSVSTINVKDEPISDDETEVKAKLPKSGDSSDEDISRHDENDTDSEHDKANDVDEDFDHEEDIKRGIKNEDSKIQRKLNDAEDGCTVFITNVPFSVDKEQLAEFAKKTGPIKYAVICMDPMTEHSRGTAFVKFETVDIASKFMNLSRDDLTIDGQALQPKPALLREHLGDNKTKKHPKDNRNLYLVKEGVIIAGTKAAFGVSASDMAKRLTLEQNKTQMLRNLNRFISRYRLVIQNLPPHYNDVKLRNLCLNSVPGKPTITEARVMRNLRSPIEADGKYPSKGYGFVMFTRHEDALECLRKINNNPDIFDKNNRPIVSFSIEDKAVLNARKKRLEKSLQRNPLSKQYQKPTEQSSEKSIEDSINNKRKKNKSDFNRKDGSRNMKRPLEASQPIEDQLTKKKKRFSKKPKRPELHGDKEIVEPPFKGRHVNNIGEYSGLTSKPGSYQKLRSNFKLRKQAEIHRKTVKAEKTKQKKSLKLKSFNKEKIRQPKQKQKTNSGKKASKGNAAQKGNTSFSDLVNKYKSKLVSNKGDKVKSKWYENQ